MYTSEIKEIERIFGLDAERVLKIIKDLRNKTVLSKKWKKERNRLVQIADKHGYDTLVRVTERLSGEKNAQKPKVDIGFSQRSDSLVAPHEKGRIGEGKLWNDPKFVCFLKKKRISP